MIVKIKTISGKEEDFYVENTKNPCGCGSNVFRKIDTGRENVSVCNACSRRIYKDSLYKPFTEYIEVEDYSI